jgi:hypothetical protein
MDYSGMNVENLRAILESLGMHPDDTATMQFDEMAVLAQSLTDAGASSIATEADAVPPSSSSHQGESVPPIPQSSNMDSLAALADNIDTIANATAVSTAIDPVEASADFQEIRAAGTATGADDLPPVPSTGAPLIHDDGIRIRPGADPDAPAPAQTTVGESATSGMSNANAESVATFCDITGCEPTTAEHMLDACGWELSDAMALYMEQNEGSDGNVVGASADNTLSGITGSSINPSNIMDNTSMDQDAMTGGFHVNNPIADRVYGDGNQTTNTGMGFGYGNAYNPYQSPAERAAMQRDELERAEYEAMHGVRRPDQTRRQRLVDDNPRGMGGMMGFPMGGMGGMGAGGGFDSGSRNNGNGMLDDPSVDWLFPPPKHLTYTGSFEEAKQIAKNDSKWLVVNIQSHTEFTSHMLNRDTWCNETIESLMRSSFLFWQRGHTSPDAREYMSLYALDETADLPHVAIVDTRTGARIVTMKGYIGPDQMIASLVEFLDENRFDDFSAPKQRIIAGKSSAAASTHDRNDMGYHYSDDEEDKSDDKNDDADGSYSPVSRNKKRGNSFDVLTDGDDGDDVEVTSPKDNGVRSASSSAASLSSGGMMIGTGGEEKTIEVVDYGSVPDEPAASDPTTRVQIKLATGKAVVRKYKLTDTVRGLFAVSKNALGDATGENGQSFELSTSFPKRELSECLDMTIEEAGLKGTQVIMRWL